jgi:hypothetical protein
MSTAQGEWLLSSAFVVGRAAWEDDDSSRLLVKAHFRNLGAQKKGWELEQRLMRSKSLQGARVSFEVAPLIVDNQHQRRLLHCRC